MSVSDFSRPTAGKRQGRPRGSLAAKSIAIREAVLDQMTKFEQMTVRQVFYALTVQKIIPKDESGYRSVQRQILNMRRENVLPWEFIADGTRWRSAPECSDSADDVLRETARTYRRNLWRTQRVRIEVWLEKDALASVISPTTHEWGVSLMVSRGQSSDTFIYSAAQEARAAWDVGVETVVYALFDADMSGRIAAEKIREKLSRYSEIPITFDLLAVTDEQIQAWDLPARPAKEKGEPDAVELDAIPPDKLNALVHDAIVQHIDQNAWRLEQIFEAEEREKLLRLVGAT